DDIQTAWLQELYKVVRLQKPQFLALHLQEVGGKDYMLNMDLVEKFLKTLLWSEEMKDYDRAQVYIDSDFKDTDNFTALGSVFFIHKSLKPIYQYDFKAKKFIIVSGKDFQFGSLDRITTIEKEKFPQNFWPDFKWTRKGYMRTRWIIHDSNFDLVNVHLFHDASNLVAWDSSPSIYCGNRQKALQYIINRITDHRYTLLPFFLFGDFNFRLDTRSLVQTLCSSAEIQTVREDNSNEVERIVCEERDNDHKVLLQIEKKMFEYLNQEVFKENNGRALLKYDKELLAFRETITEEEILFPPSYPYSEDSSKPTQYMNTRCPAWCDRVLMSHSAKDIVHGAGEEAAVVYDNVGLRVCMGDHKPVFLFFNIKA
uniref:inositol-polyphosphate 5-phosphatase n=2 Tax=Latimeria chalumnae TaxID=7897 RepID=H3ACA3_LATCH